MSRDLVRVRCRLRRLYGRAGFLLVMMLPAGFAAGCLPLMALDVAAPMGLHAVEAVGVATGQSVSSGSNTTTEEDEAKCDQLKSGMPYITEVKKDQQGGVEKDGQGDIELRQWSLSGASGKPQWTVVYTAKTSPEGWSHGPDIDQLNFDPPLEGPLSSDNGRYLVFAPAQANDSLENEQLVSFISFFGPADGTFQWRGRTYNYAVAKTLPCFVTPS